MSTYNPSIQQLSSVDATQAYQKRMANPSRPVRVLMDRPVVTVVAVVSLLVGLYVSLFLFANSEQVPVDRLTVAETPVDVAGGDLSVGG